MGELWDQSTMEPLTLTLQRCHEVTEETSEVIDGTVR